MSEPFLSEIRMVGFNFAPRGWAFCDGQILPINQNQSLYSLLGTTFGGNGSTSFALPDLRGRSPRKNETGGLGVNALGGKSGAETVTLTTAEIPGHSHNFRVNADSSDSLTPQGNYLGKDVTPFIYHDNSTTTVNMAAGTVQPRGGGQAHENMQPYVTINFCIALLGLFPSRG